MMVHTAQRLRTPQPLIFSFMKRFIIIIFFLSFFFVADVHALTVVSPVVEITAAAGETQRGIVKIYNETEEEMNLQATVVVVNPETNAVTEAQEEFLNWFSLDQAELLLLPKQAAVVPFTVTVPESALPGGYYAAIIWQSVESDESVPVSVQGKIGTVVLLKIKGELNEEIGIDEMKITKTFFGLPITVSSEISNLGNVYAVPGGVLEISNWLGRKKIIPLSDIRPLLPGSSRRYEIVWSAQQQGNLFSDFWNLAVQEFEMMSIGRHTAQLYVTYGSQQVASPSVSFIVIPFRLFSILIITVVVISMWIFIERKVKRLKQRKRV